MKISKSIHVFLSVKLLITVIYFSAPVLAQFSVTPTDDNPIQVFYGVNAPFSSKNLLLCPACDKNTYSEEKKNSEEFDVKNQPDTLYSWTKLDWATSRLDFLQTGKWQGAWRPLFLTRAPLSSYPYGDVSIRIKLRSGVRFKRERNHCEVPLSEAETTVYLFSGMMNEFVICSPKVIESISLATKEHYDEMVRDYLQHKLNPQMASYYMRIGKADDFGFFDNHETCPDSMCYKEDKLISNLKFTLKLIANNDSRILFNPEIPQRDKSIERHFNTLSPIYFNANKLN